MATSRAKMEQDLNRSLVLLRLIERTLHDTEAIWQIRVGRHTYFAQVTVDAQHRSVTFSASSVFVEQATLSAELLMNGTPMHVTRMLAAAGDVIDITIEISLDHHAMV